MTVCLDILSGFVSFMTKPVGVVGVVVQWLDYLAVTQEPGVRFPATAEKCHIMWRCPSGHGINYV